MKQNIKTKYQQLTKEIIWRYNNTNYKEEDKPQVVIHETIDKDMTYISTHDIETLSNEIGVTDILNIEQDYILEYGYIPTDKQGIDKLRLLLYFYFEQKVINDPKMRKVLKMDV